jgi:predicted secreted protein
MAPAFQHLHFMKTLLVFGMALLLSTATATAQKTVHAVVSFTGADTSLRIGKGQQFLVELWVPNRKDFTWQMAAVPQVCKFTSSQIGQAATLPGQPEQQLWFFKATRAGSDTIRFVYRHPRDEANITTKTLYLQVQ